MKSYIKLYGPPVLKAIKTLEKLAIDMPEVCIMDTLLDMLPITETAEEDTQSTYQYFSTLPSTISWERCGKIISKSKEELGEYDFCFEWFTPPTVEQLNQLIGKMDEALAPLGCKYTITSKKE